MKPTAKTDQAIVEVLLSGGYLPAPEFSLRLGRDIQNTWMDSYQEVQVTNTFKMLLRRDLGLPY